MATFDNISVCKGDTTAGEEELEDEEEDEDATYSAAGSTAALTPTPAPSETAETPETNTRPSTQPEISQPPRTMASKEVMTTAVGTKRKAEVLSKESGKIGVTITTSSSSSSSSSYHHSNHHHSHSHHSHKLPRLMSPPRSPAASGAGSEPSKPPHLLPAVSDIFLMLVVSNVG